MIARHGGPSSLEARFENPEDRAHRHAEAAADGRFRRTRDYVVLWISTAIVVATLVGSFLVMLLGTDEALRKDASESLRMLFAGALAFLAGKSFSGSSGK